MTSDGCVSIVLRGVDLSTPDKIKMCCDSLVPFMTQEISNALNGPKAKGCSVSGTATSGGGVSGTITCTF